MKHKDIVGGGVIPRGEGLLTAFSNTITVKDMLMKQMCRMTRTTLLGMTLLLSQSGLFAMSRKDRAFIEKFSLPKGTLKENADKLFSDKKILKALRYQQKERLEAGGFKLFSNTWGNVIALHPDLEGWVIKYGNRFPAVTSNIRRITYAERIRVYAKTHQIPEIVLPKKYLYHLPGQKDKLSNKNYLVFSEKLELNKKGDKPPSREAIHKICKMIKRLGLGDMHPDNFSIVGDNKLAIIDTEPFFDFGTRGLGGVIEKAFLRRLRGGIGVLHFKRTMRKFYPDKA